MKYRYSLTGETRQFKEQVTSRSAAEEALRLSKETGVWERNGWSEWMECPRCSGKGHVEMSPYFAIPMPEPRKFPCEECGGRGRFFVVPDDCFTIRASEVKRHSINDQS